MKRQQINRVWIIARFAMVVLLSWSLTASASEQLLPAAETEPDKKEAAGVLEGPKIALEVPLTSPLFADVPIAVVNEEVISLEDLASALEIAHEATKGHMTKQAAAVEYDTILNRMITMQLIAREAREMGMDELTEVKGAVDASRKLITRELLIMDITKDVKVDEAEVEKLRRQMVREWKLKSVLFEKEDEAKKMETEIKAGKSFEELAAKAVEDKTAKSQGEGGYVKSRELLPAVAEVVSTMEPGAVSPVIKIGSGMQTGFTIMKLEEIRYPEDPESTERAREAVLRAARSEAVKNFVKEYTKNYVKVNNKLMDSLDFEAKKPGLENMRKDRRTIAAVKGDKPVTVKDFTEALEAKFFHGMSEDKKVNASKYEILNEIIQKRLIEKEIGKRGIEKTDSFRRRMKKEEDASLFATFVRKVLWPDVRPTQDELRAYYDEHASDYATPEMMKISALIFGTREQAQSALERLEKGADFSWMRSNAEGQVDSSTEGLLAFKGSPLVTKSLDQGLQTALLDAKPDEYRLYKSPAGHFYVLYVQDVIAPSQQPFEEAKRDVANKVFDMKVKALIDDWAGKLRDVADVKVYLASPPPSGEKTGNQ